jgi:hypothetical protein
MNGVRSFVRRASVVAVLVALAGLLGAATASSRTSDLTNPKHFFWAPGQSPSGTVAGSTSNDLIYHGGNVGTGAIGVEQKPAVYLVYWGPQWAKGFQTADTNETLYSSKTLQTYLTRSSRTSAAAAGRTSRRSTATARSPARRHASAGPGS